MWNSFEKRNFPRIQRECGITLNAGSSNEVFDVVTENIGLGGFCVNLPKPLELFSTVQIKIVLEKEGAPIECQARVAWSVKHRDFDPKLVHHDVGFEFLDISEENRSRLDRYLSQAV